MSEYVAKKWLVVQIKPNSYDLASRNLARQGFEIFLPKIRATIRKGKKFVYKETFLFPGYIFVAFDSQNSNWSKINNTYGVSKIIAFNHKPSVISNDLIMAFKSRYDDHNGLYPKVTFQKGDSIKFNSGPFADLIAKIENISRNDRIYVLLEVLGSYKKLNINVKEKIYFHKV